MEGCYSCFFSMFSETLAFLCVNKPVLYKNKASCYYSAVEEIA